MSELIQNQPGTIGDRLKRAHGQLVGLSIGVSEYPSATGLGRLGACLNDATRVREAFLDVPQLNADSSRLWSLTEKTAEKPTRNNMIGHLKRLASLATHDDRLLLYYSGHAVKVGDQLCLVPSDAFASDDADALLSVDRVKEIISESEAKQKVIVLDACYSGPDTSRFKGLPSQISNNFLQKYLAETTGAVTLSSSENDQVSWATSPDSKLSLFTYYLLRALHGEPESLDSNKHLTLYSLHSYLSAHVDRRARSFQTRQRPGLDGAVNGDFLLADFSVQLLEVEGLSFDEYPIRELNFIETEGIQIKKLMTKMTGSPNRFSEDWLEKAANSNLGEYMEDTFGRLAAQLAKQLSFGLPEVTVDENTLFFPDGSLTVRYKSDGKSSGDLEYEASFHGNWLTQSSRIGDALEALEIRPTEMVFELNGKINLDRVKAGLPAGGWDITSHLTDSVEARKSGYTMTASGTALTFAGFSPSELLGASDGTAQLQVLKGVLRLLGR